MLFYIITKQTPTIKVLLPFRQRIVCERIFDSLTNLSKKLIYFQKKKYYKRAVCGLLTAKSLEVKQYVYIILTFHIKETSF